MKRTILVSLFYFLCNCLIGQDIFVLNSGAIYKGKLIQMNDSIVKFTTQLNGKNQTLTLPRGSVKEIISKEEEKENTIRNVTVILNDYKRIKGILVREDEKEIELSNTKLTEENLIIDKSRILRIREGNQRTTFYEIGLLKGGALIGAEFDFAISKKTSFFVGGGFKGFGGGFNMYFSENYKGAGVKLVFLNQGWGDTYAGSLGGLSLFYKMTPGISIDIGLARVLARGNYNYEGYDVILNYSLGYRF